MKRKKSFCFTAIALLAVSTLIFSGCPEEAEKGGKIDPALAGNWSNEEAGSDLKTFTIQPNGSFSATLDVLTGEYGTGHGTVTGVLAKEGSDYMMNKMKEITSKDWGSAVSLFDRTYVQITLSNGNNTFTLECGDNPIVEIYFGGTYYRQ
jgi:hypothetical protein